VSVDDDGGIVDGAGARTDALGHGGRRQKEQKNRNEKSVHKIVRWVQRADCIPKPLQADCRTSVLSELVFQGGQGSIDGVRKRPIGIDGDMRMIDGLESVPHLKV
jgi:hypothetical protein